MIKFLIYLGLKPPCFLLSDTSIASSRKSISASASTSYISACSLSFSSGSRRLPPIPHYFELSIPSDPTQSYYLSPIRRSGSPTHRSTEGERVNSYTGCLTY